MHIQLEHKLRDFLDNPLQQTLDDRTKIDETVDLARKVLKAEWEVTKCPDWKQFWKCLIKDRQNDENKTQAEK